MTGRRRTWPLLRPTARPVLAGASAAIVLDGLVRLRVVVEKGGKKEGISRKKSFGGCAKDWGGLFSACGSRAGGFEVLCVVEKRL